MQPFGGRRTRQFFLLVGKRRCDAQLANRIHPQAVERRRARFEAVSHRARVQFFGQVQQTGAPLLSEPHLGFALQVVQ